jgi:hypothetical protein
MLPKASDQRNEGLNGQVVDTSQLTLVPLDLRTPVFLENWK